MSIFEVITTIGLICSSGPNQCVINEYEEEKIIHISICTKGAKLDKELNIGIMDFDNVEKRSRLIVDTKCVNV